MAIFHSSTIETTTGRTIEGKNHQAKNLNAPPRVGTTSDACTLSRPPIRDRERASVPAEDLDPDRRSMRIRSSTDRAGRRRDRRDEREVSRSPRFPCTRACVTAIDQ